jgi:Lrp/AsnC family transcriptional regulator, leucine-responsive regulatory protein
MMYVRYTRTMSVDIHALDAIDIRMLSELQKNGRQTFAALGRKAGLSLPAAAERVRKMEDSGVILGYRAEVDAARLGYPITAFVRMKSVPQNYGRFKHVVAGLSEIVECHHVAGEDSFQIKLVASSIGHLEELVGKLSAFGQTTTSIVLSTVLSRNLAGLKPAGMLG